MTNKYNYNMLRITLLILIILAVIFLIITSGNYGNYKRGMFIGSYSDYVNKYNRAPDFSNDKFNKKVLFFMSNPANSTENELISTRSINASLDASTAIPTNLVLIKTVLGEANLDGKYKVITPNTFMLLDEYGKEVRRSSTIRNMNELILLIN
jgi:hypothetical protein